MEHKDKGTLRKKLVERFSQLSITLPPKGFVSAIQDIDVDIYEFDGYIAGLVESYLSGAMLDPVSIDLGNDIDRKLDECEQKLRELRAYKDMVSEQR